MVWRYKKGRDWGVVEERMGTALPDDYKEMMGRFPSGFFRNAVSFENPIDSRVDLDDFVRNRVQRTIGALGNPDLEYLQSTDYHVFPQPGGLLPWGNDLQGGIFCWRTEPDDPNQWPIAYYSADLLKWFEHDGGVVEIIWEVLTHAGRDNILRRNLDHEQPVFRVPSTYMGDGEWVANAGYR